LIDFEDKKILVVSPHTDDAELCAGGTIARAVEEGAKVDVTAFSLAHSIQDQEAVAKEFLKASDVLGFFVVGFPHLYTVRTLPDYRQQLLDLLLTYSQGDYDLVIGPSTRDTHQDHETVAKEMFRAFKHTNIWAWEAPWNNITSEVNLFIPLTEGQMATKIEAIQQYGSQFRVDRQYFCEDYQWALAKSRGVQIGCEYAEAFETVRMVK
jgi:LmbE family N-acetylglucosaminyl deacetylase